MLSCLFGGADAVQLRVCLIQIRDQQINPQRQLAVGQSPAAGTEAPVLSVSPAAGCIVRARRRYVSRSRPSETARGTGRSQVGLFLRMVRYSIWRSSEAARCEILLCVAACAIRLNRLNSNDCAAIIPACRSRSFSARRFHRPAVRPYHSNVSGRVIISPQSAG